MLAGIAFCLGFRQKTAMKRSITLVEEPSKVEMRCADIASVLALARIVLEQMPRASLECCPVDRGQRL